MVANAESERIEDNVWGVRPREVDVRSMLRSRRFHTWYRRHWQDILNQTIAVRPLGITDIPEEILAIDTIRYHSGFRNQAMHSDKYREFYRKRNNLASGDGHRDDDDGDYEEVGLFGAFITPIRKCLKKGITSARTHVGKFPTFEIG